MQFFRMRSFGIASLLLLFVSCQDQSEVVPGHREPVLVHFEKSAIALSESDEFTTVKLLLGAAAPHTGKVSILLEGAGLGVGLIAEPAISEGKLEVPVAKGANSVTFKIKHEDNTVLDGNRTVIFNLLGASEGFKIGSQSTSVITIYDNEVRVMVGFTVNESSLQEDMEGKGVVVLSFNEPAPAPGTLVVELTSTQLTYGLDYNLQPAAINNRINIAVQTGQTQVAIEVDPIDNQLKSGNRSFELKLIAAEGGLVTGTAVTHAVTVVDNDIVSNARSYETVAGNWRTKRLYEFNDDGTLAKVTWEQYTPAYSGGTYTYEYIGGRVHKMVQNANRETYYLWEGDRIVRTEQYTNGLLTELIELGYDPAGNVGEARTWNLQPNGEMKKSFHIVYLYFTDGNVYKKLVHTFDDEDELVLIATHTYDGYLAFDNPFPLEILPNMNAQPKLPSIYRVETNGSDLQYNLSYQFNEAGQLVHRTATSPQGSETSSYHYY